jgi:hypothetical protein
MKQGRVQSEKFSVREMFSTWLRFDGTRVETCATVQRSFEFSFAWGKLIATFWGESFYPGNEF